MYVTGGRTEKRRQKMFLSTSVATQSALPNEHRRRRSGAGRVGVGKGRGEFVSAPGSDDRARAVADADVGMDDGDRPH